MQAGKDEQYLKLYEGVDLFTGDIQDKDNC